LKVDDDPVFDPLDPEDPLEPDVVPVEVSGVGADVVPVEVSELEPEVCGAVPTGLAQTPPLDVPPLGLVIGPH
jgi:hypothetical protein